MKEFLTRISLARPRRNVNCILFTATAALVAAMLAAGIPVRRHPLRADQFVAPVSSIGYSKFWELLQDRRFQYLAVVTFLVSPTNSVQLWSLPPNWNNGVNTIETIGGGGSGSSTASIGTGGGGAGYSAASNILLVSPGALYQIGAGGGSVTGTSNGQDGTDSFFNGGSLAASSVGAKAGLAGVDFFISGSSQGGAGGDASAGVAVGTSPVKFSGGRGGNASPGGVQGGANTGGGGAAGLHGNGNHGQDIDASDSTGGSGDAGSGGAGGSARTNGGDGTEYSSGPARGSGGGGGSNYLIQNGTAGSGGNFGGGGGSSFSGPSGSGSQGLIVITFTPLILFGFNLAMGGL